MHIHNNNVNNNKQAKHTNCLTCSENNVNYFDLPLTTKYKTKKEKRRKIPKKTKSEKSEQVFDIRNAFLVVLSIIKYLLNISLAYNYIYSIYTIQNIYIEIMHSLRAQLALTDQSQINQCLQGFLSCCLAHLHKFVN